MKNLLSIFAIALLAASCCKSDYKLTADFNNDEENGQKVYLVNYDTGDTIDSVVVTGRRAVFEGSVKDAMVARLLTAGARATFILEGGEIEINWEDRVAKGTALNDSVAKANEEQANIGHEMEELAQSNLSEDEINKKAEDLNNKWLNGLKAHYENNKKNAFGWWSLYNYMLNNELTLDEMKALLADAPESYSQSVRINRLLTAAENVEKTKVGCKMVDFTVKTEDGLETRLSDFVGKGDIVVVDFWASWCGPCRREASTTLKDIYEKYDGKGLKIIGVAVWDKPEDTFSAIESLSLPWPQIINSQNIASDAYGFNAIPHIIIFSGDGTILSRGLQGDELKAKVDSLMNK